jgi:hypothetical protein
MELCFTGWERHIMHYVQLLNLYVVDFYDELIGQWKYEVLVDHFGSIDAKTIINYINLLTSRSAQEDKFFFLCTK